MNRLRSWRIVPTSLELAGEKKESSPHNFERRRRRQPSYPFKKKMGNSTGNYGKRGEASWLALIRTSCSTRLQTCIAAVVAHQARNSKTRRRMKFMLDDYFDDGAGW